MTLRAKKTGIDRQLLCINDKAKFLEIIDQLGDDGIAILIARKSEEGESQLTVTSYGEGQETEFLGLLGYGTVILHREYFTPDEP